MFGAVLELLKKRFRREARRAGFKAGFGFVALVFAVIGVAGLFISLFLALEPTLGALRAALTVSGVAFALAILASTPLWWPRRRPPPPDLTLTQLLALASGGGAALSARQMAIAGVVIALALGAAAAKKK